MKEVFDALWVMSENDFIVFALFCMVMWHIIGALIHNIFNGK